MPLFNIFVFPGILFLVVAGLWFEFVDRRMYARMQHRQGPPWFQPLADFIKLIAKETIIPEDANKLLFVAMPIVALTASALEGDKQICLDAGMDDFLPKPLNPEQLRSVLARYTVNEPNTVAVAS